eukprot:gene8354-17212_t
MIFSKTITDQSQVTSAKTYSLLSRSNFIEALTRVAFDLSKGENIPQTIEQLLSETVLQFWNKLNAAYKLYSCTDGLMRKTFADNYIALKTIFLEFSMDHLQLGPGLTLNSLSRILNDSMIIPSTTITRAEEYCRPVHSRVQLDVTATVTLKTFAPMPELVFVEYVEAVVRLAILANISESKEEKGEDNDAIYARSAFSALSAIYAK